MSITKLLFIITFSSLILTACSNNTSNTSTNQLTACEEATRKGMNTGCGIDRDATDSVVIDKNIEPMNNDACEQQRKIGMDQGCSTAGGTGYSTTHTAEDGNLGTCRQSYRAGDPVPKGCSDQTPVDNMVIPK